MLHDIPHHRFLVFRNRLVVPEVMWTYLQRIVIFRGHFVAIAI